LKRRIQFFRINRFTTIGESGFQAPSPQAAAAGQDHSCVADHRQGHNGREDINRDEDRPFERDGALDHGVEPVAN
jgi:hypothetical protein